MSDKLAVTINDTELPIKEYQRWRVVTLKEIDAVHDRPEGTAGRNFNTNKKHLIEGTDYFQLSYEEARSTKFVERPNSQGITLLTESGYLMLVKSFTDNLAWTVQRQLVNVYFRATEDQRKDAAQQTKQQTSKRPALSSINGAMKITIDAMKAAGVAPEYIALTVADAYKPYGINIPGSCLPEREGLYECETIAKELGIFSESGNPHKNAVSAIIGLVGTLEGETKMVPFTQGGYVQRHMSITNTQTGYGVELYTNSGGIRINPGGNFWVDASGGSMGITESGVISGADLVPLRSGYYALGRGGLRWTDVYADNGTIVTSDREKKMDIAYGLDAYSAFFDALRPVSYRLKDGSSGRTHLGLIAQDVEKALEDCGLSGAEFAGFVKAPRADGGADYALRYEEFIALLIREVQDLKGRISKMEGAVQ